MPALAHLGINAVFLVPGLGGLDTLVQRLVPELLRAQPELRISVYLNATGREYVAGAPWASEVRLRTHPALGVRGLRAASELTLLGLLASRDRVDVLHSVAMTGPVWTRAAHVVTLADLTWMIEPDTSDAVTTRLWNAIIPPVVRRADRLLTYSEDTKRQAVRRLGLDPERIDVVAPGIGSEPGGTRTGESELRARLGLGDGPVILAVGAKKPHKNLGRLIEALPAVRERVPSAALVLAGAPTSHEADLRDRAAALGLLHPGGVVFTAFLEQPDLEGLYALASCFAFASLNEGFGLPVLEAMQRGVPVACSDSSSLPEVAGSAARFFDPRSTDTAAEAILGILTDPTEAERLRAAGREQAGRFSWRAHAEGSLRAYERALSDT